MELINIVVWLCLASTGPEGSLMGGHTPTYSAGIQVHTLQVVPSGCAYYRIRAECEVVYDRYDERFRTTYLCQI